MNEKSSSRKKWLVMGASCVAGLLILLLVHFAMDGGLPGQKNQGALANQPPPQIAAQGNQNFTPSTPFNGRIPSLSWIVGRDCRNGVQAYLQSASTNPDAALVGTGWLDPTTGLLINGQSNNCVSGSLSMDSVVKMVHQHGGRAYLTITMETDGSSTTWTTAQQTAYIVKATQTPGYINPILSEVQRVDYDGVIMDLEGTDNNDPNIQQLFATYNQMVWQALQPMHKLYGIALIHKVSDHDAYYGLNGFENWKLLGKCADFIVLMAVDQSYWTPGPSVSVPWLKQLLAYAQQTMPQMVPHIIWELPLYGDIWHQAQGQWVFDGTIDYQDAMNIVESTSTSHINQAQSSMQDAYQPHLVYTDATGVTHSLWFMTAQSLHAIMRDFQTFLRQQPQLAQSQLQFAIWWLTSAEPVDFWQMVDSLY